MSWLSIANNLAANEVNLELSEHQSTLGTSVRDLSSGLRVNTAADDPSGNAIATSLQTHAQAFTQASQNVENAQNAGAVADGALASVTDILLRIRELAVGAASSVDSSTDRADIQSEIDQLLIEINRIAQNTNFNGRALLDGSIAGYQPAQSAQAIVESNSVLLSGTTGTGGFLLASSGIYSDTLESAVEFGIAQDVTPSAAPQTVKVDSTAGLAAGDVFALGTADIAAGNIFTPTGGMITIQSVDTANDTITAVFSATVAQGEVASGITNTTLKVGVAAGTQIATLANPSPLYAGEIITVGYSALATNDVVVVQQVLSSTSFIATFSRAEAAGAGAYAGDEIYSEGGGTINAGLYTISTPGEAWDGAPIGTTAYVVENTGNVTKVVGQGTVVGGGVSSSVIDFPQKITIASGGYMIMTQSGLGSTPLVSTVDGTIKLTVVNQSGTIGVQETFYDTATQTSVTSPYLLSPGERAMLYDGVVTTLGDFGAADVGSTAYIKVLQSVAAVTSAGNPALTVQSGDDEGDLIQVGIPAMNTNTLRISTVTVIGASGTDPTLASEDTIGQLDYALQQVTAVRAQIGAQIVRLGIDQTNDDTASTELTASQSNIADLDVGEATTAFTEQQVDIDVSTSLLQQVNALPDQILKLFQTQTPP